MENRAGDEAPGEGGEASFPEGYVKETVESAIEAARMGVDTLLLAQGNAATREKLLEWLRERVTDHGVNYETHGVAIWSWGGGGNLLISSSTAAGHKVYSRMGAGGRLEIMSAKKQ